MDTRNAAKAERQREASLMREIMAAIGALDGVVVHRNNCGTATYGSGARVEYGVGGKGAPDLLVEVQSRGVWLCLWLEVKTPDGRVEPHQRAWHAAARSMGRHVAVVRSVVDAQSALDAARHGFSGMSDIQQRLFDGE